MSISVEEATRHHARRLDDAQSPVSFQEIITRVPSADERFTVVWSRRVWVTAVALAVTLVVVGLVPLLLDGEPDNDDAVTPGPGPTVTTIAPGIDTDQPSNQSTTDSSPSDTPVSTQAEAAGPDLMMEGAAWRQIDLADVVGWDGPDDQGNLFDGGDRLVIVHGSEPSVIEAVSTSESGAVWTTRYLSSTLRGEVIAAWGESVVVAEGGGGWGRSEDEVFPLPTRLSILHADGSVDRHVFDGDVRAVGAGAPGFIVAVERNGSHGDIIDEALGSEFSDSAYRTELNDGSLFVETDSGRRAEFRLSDHGYSEDDLWLGSGKLDGPGAVVGWHSADGGVWSEVPGLPADIDVAGTSGGFFGVSPTSIWYSTDGLAWTTLGETPPGASPWDGVDEPPLRWRKGVVVPSDSGLWYLSASGMEQVVEPAGLSAAGEPRPIIMSSASTLFAVDTQQGQIHATSDGEEWASHELPSEIWYTPGWYRSGAAATREAIAMLLWQETGDGPTPSWWLTVKP